MTTPETTLMIGDVILTTPAIKRFLDTLGVGQNLSQGDPLFVTHIAPGGRLNVRVTDDLRRRNFVWIPLPMAMDARKALLASQATRDAREGWASPVMLSTFRDTIDALPPDEAAALVLDYLDNPYAALREFYARHAPR